MDFFFIFQAPPVEILVQPDSLNERDEILQNENGRNTDGDENMVENEQILIPVVEMNLSSVIWRGLKYKIVDFKNKK